MRRRSPGRSRARTRTPRSHFGSSVLLSLARVPTAATMLAFLLFGLVQGLKEPTIQTDSKAGPEISMHDEGDAETESRTITGTDTNTKTGAKMDSKMVAMMSEKLATMEDLMARLEAGMANLQAMHAFTEEKDEEEEEVEDFLSPYPEDGPDPSLALTP